MKDWAAYEKIALDFGEIFLHILANTPNDLLIPTSLAIKNLQIVFGLNGGSWPVQTRSCGLSL